MNHTHIYCHIFPFLALTQKSHTQYTLTNFHLPFTDTCEGFSVTPTL